MRADGKSGRGSEIRVGGEVRLEWEGGEQWEKGKVGG